MPKFNDITGQRFGRWHVLSRAEDKLYRCGTKQPCFLCRCDCGTEKIVTAKTLRDGSSKSCGCWNAEVRRSLCRTRNTKHGHARSPTYKIWQGIISRCHNPKASGFHKYGARGITVCDRWRESYINFLDDMGLKPSPLHSIERVNPFKGYEPGNCEWKLLSEQQNNKRNSAISDFDDIKRLIQNFASSRLMTPHQLFDFLFPHED